jgi:exodeoxyribonuclease III
MAEMADFVIATWNVNSLRVRLPHVLSWLQSVKPDILVLQETKILDEGFPFGPLQEIGYDAIASGQKTYNGVAILIKKNESLAKFSDILTDIPTLIDAQRRIIILTIGDIRILNLYVPNGENVYSEKYQYKLNWLKCINEHLKLEIQKYPKLLILGDYNIAPAEIDVHDPSLWEGQVLFSEQEREAFREILDIGFRDCYRILNPSEKNFSWWDYRLHAFKRNLGLRIDHILASFPLAEKCKQCYIDKMPRSWERPSDHAPVIAHFHL